MDFRIRENSGQCKARLSTDNAAHACYEHVLFKFIKILNKVFSASLFDLATKSLLCPMKRQQAQYYFGFLPSPKWLGKKRSLSCSARSIYKHYFLQSTVYATTHVKTKRDSSVSLKTSFCKVPASSTELKFISIDDSARHIDVTIRNSQRFR